jgi:beta-lactamase regulating signal transducer with metallopeptidase domain
MLRLLERARANVRYVVCWAALILIVVLPALPSFETHTAAPNALSLISAGAIVSVPDVWWTSTAVMMAAWMVWVGVSTIRFTVAMVALRRARTGSRPFPPQVESFLGHWRQMRGEGRRPALVLSDAVPTAAVLGCGSPVIAVAPSLMTTLDADELDRVLIHEWAHVQRRDDLLNILQIVIRIIAGWHPAVWWIERRLHVEREIACDEMAVALTGSPKSYAECLVKLASLRGAAPIALAGPAVLATSGLRARITRIVSRHPFIAPFWSRGIATAIVSVLCMMSLGVAGVRLVEVTAFALPLESIRMVNVGFSGAAPVMPRTTPGFTPSAPARRQSLASAQSAQRRAVEDAAPETTATPNPEPRITPAAPSAVDSTVPQAAADGDDGDTQAVAAEATVVDAPRTQQVEATEQSRSPWAGAADAGTAIGRKSKEAGVATAGAFTRFARRVAGSF